MFYSISGLCPIQQMGGYGFNIKLWPGFKDMVTSYNIDQEKVDKGIENMGRHWLDICGYDSIYDPDNSGFDRDKNKPLGPNARPMYLPNRDLRISWGEWGPEHITVPGNACGLDIDRSIGAPRNGRILLPHNVDCWQQVNLLLITFCWFADTLALNFQIKEREKIT